AQRDAGTFDAGHVSVPLTAADLAEAPQAAELELTLHAKSAYASGGSPASASVSLTANGGGSVPPATAMLLPAWPNPAPAGPRLPLGRARRGRAARHAHRARRRRPARARVPRSVRGRRERAGLGRARRQRPPGALGAVLL